MGSQAGCAGMAGSFPTWVASAVLALTLACTESALAALPTHAGAVASQAASQGSQVHRLPWFQSLAAMTTAKCHKECKAKGEAHKADGYLMKWLFDGHDCKCHILVVKKCGKECKKAAESHKDFTFKWSFGKSIKDPCKCHIMVKGKDFGKPVMSKVNKYVTDLVQ